MGDEPLPPLSPHRRPGKSASARCACSRQSTVVRGCLPLCKSGERSACTQCMVLRHRAAVAEGRRPRPLRSLDGGSRSNGGAQWAFHLRFGRQRRHGAAGGWKRQAALQFPGSQGGEAAGAGAESVGVTRTGTGRGAGAGAGVEAGRLLQRHEDEEQGAAG